MIEYAAGRGRPPTMREIGERFAIASPNGVSAHLKALEKKGYIARIGDGTSRCWRVVKGPDGLPVEGEVERLRTLLVRVEHSLADCGLHETLLAAVRAELGLLPRGR